MSIADGDFLPFSNDLVIRHTLKRCNQPAFAAVEELVANLPADLQFVAHDVNLAEATAERQIRADNLYLSLSQDFLLDIEMQNRLENSTVAARAAAVRRFVRYAMSLLGYLPQLSNADVADPAAAVVVFGKFDIFGAGKSVAEVWLDCDAHQRLAAELALGREKSFVRVFFVNAPVMMEDERFPLLSRFCRLIVTNEATDAGTELLLETSRLVQSDPVFRKDFEMISMQLEDRERHGIKIGERRGIKIGERRGIEIGERRGRSDFGAQIQELSALVAGLPNALDIINLACADPDRVDDLIAQYR